MCIRDRDIMSGKDADDLARQENLEEFLSGMSAFVEERREAVSYTHLTGCSSDEWIFLLSSQLNLKITDPYSS